MKFSIVFHFNFSLLFQFTIFFLLELFELCTTRKSYIYSVIHTKYIDRINCIKAPKISSKHKQFCCYIVKAKHTSTRVHFALYSEYQYDTNTLRLLQCYHYYPSSMSMCVLHVLVGKTQRMNTKMKAKN